MDVQQVEAGTEFVTINGTAELESLVQSRLGGQIRGFRLGVVAQGLVLHGRTRTYHAKQLAQHAVMTATRLPIRANEIVVS